MKRLLVGCLLIAVVCPAAGLRVDHVTIAGRDLQGLRARLAAAGIRTDYGGKHTNGLTEMAVASFADGSYLELIAAQDARAGAPEHYWGKFIDGDAGPCAWAIGVTDLDSEARRLHTKINASGRARPDGVKLEWRTASIGSEAQGTFFPFMIQDVTDRGLRANPSGKATMPEWRGVAEVFIAVRDLEEEARRYRETFRLNAPRLSFDRTFDAKSARFEDTPVVLVSAETGWVAERLAKFGEGTCAFVIATSKTAHSPTIQWLPIEGMRIGLIK